MAGIEQSSATVLKFLRNLFNEQTDELLIIKELLQNADDSGANQVTIGCSEGLPDAAHPLLRGPALFAVNDGPFRPEDARAIVTLGLSTKGGDASTVGKFGLGLKSAFYLAEALFFMDSRHDPKDSWRKSHFDILSPWVGGDEPYRPDWVTFTPEDRALVLEHLGSLGLPLGFVVWIPLRQEAACLKAGEERPAIVVRHYPGDKPFTIPLHVQQEIRLMLPMMGNVTQIGIKALPSREADVHYFQRVGPGRTTRLQGDSAFTKSFGGAIQNQPTGTVAYYVGTEALSPTQDLTELSTGKYWPTTEVATAYGEEYRRDPSVPHGAVVWQREASDAPTLQASWSVFLPVEDALARGCPLPGPDSYALTLHGYFFLRPDRKSIYGLHRKAATNVHSEEWVRERWNDQLASTTVLPYVLKGLASITADADDSVKAALTRAIVESPLGQGHTHTLTAEHQWARLVRGGEFRWELMAPAVQLLPLTETEDTSVYAAALEALVAPALLRDAAAPALVRNEPRFWPVPVMNALFDQYQLQEVLIDSALMRLFLSLRPHLPVADQRGPLGQRFRAALQAVGFSELGKRRDEVAEFLTGYLAPRLLSLPAEGMGRALTERLIALDIGVTLVPDGFVVDPKPGNLTAQQAAAILDTIQEADDIAPVLRFVKRHLAEGVDFEGLVLDRPLLPTNQGSQGDGRWLTLREAQELAAESRIFRQQRDESVLLTHLRDVLGETSLHFVSGAILTALEVDQSIIPRLSTKAILETLRNAHHLGSTKHRLNLLQRILSDSPSVTDSSENRAVLRLLLHGEAARIHDLEHPLLVTSDPRHLWGRVAQLASNHSSLGWTVVLDKVDFLSPKDMKRLNVAEVSPQVLIPLLQEAAPRFPGGELTPAEREELVLQITDDDLLQRLPIFLTKDGQLTAITDGVYLEGGLQAASLVGQMTVLQASSRREVQDRLLKLAPPLSYRNVWELILNEPEPWRHWQILSEALRSMTGVKPPRSSELPWWPLTAGGGVAPKDILLFAHQESREEIKKLRDASGSTVPVQEDLDPEFNEQFFPGLLRLVAPEDQQRNTLLSLVAAAKAYHVGTVTVPPAVWLRAFEGVGNDELPLIGLLRALEGAREVQSALLTAAARPLQAEHLLSMLERLYQQVVSEGVETRDAVEKTYPALLGDLRLQRVPPNALSRLHFLNAAKQWRKAEDLVAFGPQFEPASVLHSDHADALYGSEPVADFDPSAPRDLRSDVSVEIQVKNGAQDLRRHLREWEHTPVPREQLGAFLGLIDGNPGLHDAAQAYLVTFNLGVLRENAFRDVSPGVLPRGFDSYQAMHDQIRLLVTLHKGKTTQVRNLLGEPLEVAFKADDTITSLFTASSGQRPFHHAGSFIYPVEFKVVNLRAPDIDYAGLLFQSLLWVLNHYIKVTPPHLREEFDKIVDSSQATVAATQNRLIKVASQTWGRQLGVAHGSVIREVLQQIEVTDRNAEQARDQGAQQQLRRAEIRIRELQAQLKELVETDQETQRELLKGVQRKITDMQYTPQSVAFELLQNADDALSEWEEMTSSVDDVRRTFHAELSDGLLRFVHHGRPINFFSHGDFDGRRRGFDGDLEKMLTLMSSDKGAGVTGKFGLGFKSVFLISAQPTVKSDRLAFTVKGGVYPVTPDEEHVHRMRTYLEKVAPAELQDATLIDLPVMNKDLAEEAFDQFSKLAPFSLAFTRTLRQLQLRSGKEVHRHRSQEEVLAPGVAVITLQGGADTRRGLALYSGTFKLVLPLAAQGFGRFDPDFPTLWVTAPTAERLRLPFMMNAAFPLDTGRAQLARNETALLGLVSEIRPDLRSALESLLSLQKQGALNKLLGWSAKAKGDLPSSLWNSLAIPLSREDSNPAFLLLKDLLWGPEGAYGALTTQQALIPNGLPEPFSAAIRAGDPKLKTVDFPATLLAPLARDSRFLKAYPAVTLVHSETVRIMQRLGLPTPGADLTLPEVLNHLLPDGRVSPELTSWLAPVLNEEVVDELYEDEEVSIWLDNLTFQTQSGSYAPAGDLVMAGNGEEGACFRFAPRTAQLSDAYETAGIVLFRRLRGELLPSHQRTLEWLLSAKGEARTHALRYIANQVPSGPLLSALRARLPRTWLEHTQLLDLPQWEQLDEAQQRDILNALRQTKEVYTQPVSEPPQPQSDEDDSAEAETEEGLSLPPDFLPRLVAWWKAEGTAETQRYNERLYPSGTPFVTMRDFDSDTPCHRRAWLALLMLGSLQSMGRTKPEAHRNFLAMCEEKGWLEEFSTRKAPDSAWMKSVRTYLTGDAEMLKYYQWMRGFVGFYQLGHWLDEYVEVLRQMDHLEPRSLRLLLAPNVNPELQGSGIDAPPLTGTLGMGGPFVIRELLRHKILRNDQLTPLAYVPTRRIRLLMAELTRKSFPQGEVEGNSRAIHAHLVQTLGTAQATFGGQYDLPLHILLGSSREDATALALQNRVLGRPLFRGAQ